MTRIATISQTRTACLCHLMRRPSTPMAAPRNSSGLTDVQPDDTVSDGRMLIDMSDDKTPGITDGMKVDTKGNIWESGPGGIWIVSPQGKHLGTIFTPKLVGTLEFGDADHETLYIAARSDVYKIHLNVGDLRGRTSRRSGQIGECRLCAHILFG